MLTDPLAAALSKLNNAENKRKKIVEIKVSSKIIKQVLDTFKKGKYIEDYREEPETYGKKLIVRLSNSINKCNAIKPRYNVKLSDFEKFEKRYLPAKGFGMIVISTNKGIMTLEEAAKKKLGGRLLAFVY